MDVTCSQRGCGRPAEATIVVRLVEGRDKGKQVSIWVCGIHRKPGDAALPKRQVVGEAGAAPEIAL
jgi:hypothetical protein